MKDEDEHRLGALYEFQDMLLKSSEFTTSVRIGHERGYRKLDLDRYDGMKEEIAKIILSHINKLK